MKATIHDSAVLRELGPLEVAAYLRSSGWKQVDTLGDKGAVWSWRSPKGEKFELLVPLRRDLRDYAARMADILRGLEAAEKRSQLEILDDLSTNAADIIRVRSDEPETSDGTIPIDEGVQLVQHARDMLFAAACSAVEPRIYFPTRRPPQAVQYMETVRLGQTERGSYVVTLISSVPPHLQPEKDGQARLDVDDPFERRVTRTLGRALTAVQKAAQEAAATGILWAVESAVSQGVSANLCEAIAGMAGGVGKPRDLEVRLTWSRSRPLESEEPRRVLIPGDAIQFIRETGRVFRETSPRTDFELEGVVIGLYQPDPQQPARVTVFGLVDGSARKVIMELAEPDHKLAIRAYEDQALVRCQGQLVKSGKQLELQRPQSFELVRDQ